MAHKCQFYFCIHQFMLYIMGEFNQSNSEHYSHTVATETCIFVCCLSVCV